MPRAAGLGTDGVALAFALPIGHPAPGLAAAERLSRLDQLRTLLRREALTFSADDTLLRHGLNRSAPAWARELFAMWPGTLAVQPDGMLTIELLPTDALALAARWPADLPLPRRFSVGPVQAGAAAPARVVVAGASIGGLAGDRLQLGFEDANGAWIDPRWCLAKFERAALWDLPAGSARPLSQPADAPAGDPVALAFARPAAERGKPQLVVSAGEPALRVFQPTHRRPAALRPATADEPDVDDRRVRAAGCAPHRGRGDRPVRCAAACTCRHLDGGADTRRVVRLPARA